MGVKDMNRVFDIQDVTTSVMSRPLDYCLFTEYGTQNFQISVGDFMLLQEVKRILLAHHDCIIKNGYRNF